MSGRKLIQKPFVVRFKTDEFLLASMYLCYFNKIPLDLLMAMYEKFGKHSLFFFKALACKGYVKLSDEQFYKILKDCKVLNKQIRDGAIDRTKFDSKMIQFLDYLENNTEDIYSYEVRLFFDLEDFYSGGY